MLAALTTEVEGLDDDELVAQLRAAEAQRRHLEAVQAVTIRELDRRRTYRRDGHATIRGLVRVVTKRPNHEIIQLLQTGRLMAAEPSVADGLASGRLGVAQVHELARARAHPRCGDELTGTDLADLIDEAVEGSYPSFHTKVADWVNLHDQDGADDHEDATHEARDAWFGFTGDEFWGRVKGGVVDGEAITKIFERLVQAEWDKDWAWTLEQHGPDGACEAKMPRTPAQRRFDALIAMALTAASTPSDAQAPEPVVNIVTDSDTLLHGLARFFGITPDASGEPADAASDSRQRRFCHTASGIPVAPRHMIAAALAGHVRRVVLDERSVVIDMGRRRRFYTGDLRIAAHMDKHRCSWPGCEVPASRCHTDHLIEWSKGGCTCPDDGIPECPRHNLMKNHGYSNDRDHKGRVHTYRPDGTEIT